MNRSKPDILSYYWLWPSCFPRPIRRLKGIVHSFKIWAKSLANGFLMTVLLSRFFLDYRPHGHIWGNRDYKTVIIEHLRLTHMVNEWTVPLSSVFTSWIVHRKTHSLIIPYKKIGLTFSFFFLNFCSKVDNIFHIHRFFL